MTTFAGHLYRYDGYGYLSLQVARHWRRPGWKVVDLAPMKAGQRVALPPGTVVACSPDWLLEPTLEYVPERTVIFTMFETDRIPGHWAPLLNSLAGCIVPTAWGREVFRRCGVTVPITVISLGIDAQEYPLCRRAPREPYTFLWSGTPDRRKGWDLVYRAFRREFGNDAAVRLVMHFRQLPEGLRGCQDVNVQLIEGRLLHSEWLLQLRSADCFVFPSRGEGWGLPPREAAATGLPAIATDWSGTAADVDQWGIPLPITGLESADYGFWEPGSVGRWAQPDETALRSLLRACATDPDEAAERGHRAALWLQGQTWSGTARGIAGVAEAWL